jgi:pimeloyl-ACP methyl ester carboxylesterase
MVVVVGLLQAWRGYLLFPAEEKTLDSGTFSITVAGKRAGSESFQIVQVGKALEVRTKTSVALPQGPTTVKGTLRTDADWKPWTGAFDSTFRGQTTRIALQRLGSSLEQVTRHPGRASVSFTRPPKQPDLYFGANVIAHLTPLCREADAKGKTITAFPAAPLKLAPATVRPYAMTKLGAPALGLTDIVADLASSMHIEVLCDGSKLVAARLYNQRVTAVRASYEELASALEGRAREKPIVPAALAELPRKVHAGGATLACTLLVPVTHAKMQRQTKKPAKEAKASAPAAPGALTFEPAPPEPLPAVVLLGDFGGQDREGNSAGPGDFHLFFDAVLAAKLGDAGIASLRCDDRGTGQSTGDARHVTLQSLLGDAAAALAALRAEPAVDGARVAVLGHSEGALVATMLAARDHKLRALALLAPPARPLDAIILDQEQASMQRFGLPKAEVAASLAELKATYDAVRAGKRLPASLSPSERRGIQDSSAWLRSHFRHAPFGEAPQLSALPVLIAQGGKDVQISIRDAELARDAFEKAGNKLVVYKVYAPLNHLFSVSRSGSVADYYDPLAEVDAGFLRDVVGFLAKPAALPAAPPPAAAPAHAALAPPAGH